jgi:hypothetical protein
MNLNQAETISAAELSTAVPQHILDHAERSYPASSRPKCPIFARNFDRDKQHCIDNRLRIEAEFTTENSPRTQTMEPMLSSASATESINAIPSPQPSADTQPLEEIQPEQILNTTRTEDEPIPNAPRTEPEQSPNTYQTNPEQIASKPSPNVANDSSAPKNSDQSHVVPSSGGSPVAPDPRLTEIEEEIIERTHHKSPLDNLPPERQELLYDLLSRYHYREVKAAIALPEPKGLGINPSLGALFNCKRRYAKRSQIEKKREVWRIANQVLDQRAITDNGYVLCSEHLLKVRLLETINNSQSKTSEVRDLFQALARIHAMALAEKRLKLAEKKLAS